MSEHLRKRKIKELKGSIKNLKEKTKVVKLQEDEGFFDYISARHVRDVDNYLANIADIANTLKDEVQRMRGMKSMIRNYNPDQYENRLTLKLSLDGLQKAIKNTLNTLDNE